MAETIRVTTTGAAASATGTGTSNTHGVLAGIVVKIHADAPATTDVTVKRTVNGVDENLLVLTDVDDSDNGFYNTQDEINAVAGGAAVADVSTPFVLSGELITVSVAGSDALTNAVQITLLTVS